MAFSLTPPATHKYHSRVQNPRSGSVHLVGPEDPPITLCGAPVGDSWLYLQQEKITCSNCLRACYHDENEQLDIIDTLQPHVERIEIEVTPEISIWI